MSYEEEDTCHLLKALAQLPFILLRLLRTHRITLGPYSAPQRLQVHDCIFEIISWRESAPLIFGFCRRLLSKRVCAFCVLEAGTSSGKLTGPLTNLHI